MHTVISKYIDEAKQGRRLDMSEITEDIWKTNKSFFGYDKDGHPRKNPAQEAAAYQSSSQRPEAEKKKAAKVATKEQKQ